MDIRFPNTGIAQPSEKNAFNRSALRDGVLRLDRAQFEALFAGLDWRKVKALEIRPPAVAE